MYPSGAHKACPGFNRRGCGKAISIVLDRCQACDKLWEAGVRLWASLGIREAEEYLAAHAAFDAWVAAEAARAHVADSSGEALGAGLRRKS